MTGSSLEKRESTPASRYRYPSIVLDCLESNLGETREQHEGINSKQDKNPET